MSRPTPPSGPHRGLVSALILALVASLADASMPPAPVMAADQEATPIVDGGVGCLAGAPRAKAPPNPGDPPAAPQEPAARRPPDPGDPPPPVVSTRFVGVLASAGTVWAADSEPMSPAQAVPSSSPESTLEPEPTPTPDRSATRLPGIDISHHNGDIDFERVRKAGKRFVFMKATQATDFIDPRFTQNVERARASGIAHGAYHFFDYQTDGRAQADHFLDVVEAQGGLDGSLPPVVDVECWRPIGPSIHVLSATRLRDFVDRVYERTGRFPIVYTSVRMWREVMGDAQGFGDLPLWAACWGCDTPALPAGWRDWVVWQTGLTRIPRVGRVGDRLISRLDGNFFNGGDRELEALRSGPLLLTNGTRFAGGSRVRLDVSRLEGTEVRTSLDGLTWGDWATRGASVPLDLPEEEREHTVYVQARLRPDLESPVVPVRLVMDLTPPVVLGPEVVLALGEVDVTSPVPGIPVTALWQAGDESSGLAAGIPLVAVCDGARTRGTAAAAAAPTRQLVARSAALKARIATECRLQVTERDGAGNAGRTTSDPFGLEFLDEDASAGLRVSGDQVAIVASRGPSQGLALVLLDGRQVAEVDLWAAEARGPEVVFAGQLDPSLVHQLAVTPAGLPSPLATEGGDPDPAASPTPGPGTEARIDGIVVLRHLEVSPAPAGSAG